MSEAKEEDTQPCAAHSLNYGSGTESGEPGDGEDISLPSLKLMHPLLQFIKLPQGF